jgi:hypothetical protein
MKKNNLSRVILGILVFLSIIWAPWWLTWSLAIIFLFYFSLYYEIFAWGIIYDALYGISLSEYWNVSYIFSIASIVLFIISFIIKKKLIIYEA